MKEVKIRNIINGRKFKCLFDDDQKMNGWINRHKRRSERGVGWGWSAREMPYSEFIKDPELQKVLIEIYDKEIEPEYIQPVYDVDDDGNPIMIPAKYEKWVKLKAEYEITITDITEEYNAREQRRKLRQALPSAEDQLEYIYKHGLAKWKEKIDEIRERVET